MFKKVMFCALALMIIASSAFAVAFPGWIKETQLIPPTHVPLGDICPSWVYGSQGFLKWDGVHYDYHHQFDNLIERSSTAPPVFDVPFNETSPHVGGLWFNTNVPVVVDINCDGQDDVVYCYSYERTFQNTTPSNSCTTDPAHAGSGHACTHYMTKLFVYTYDVGLGDFVLLFEHEEPGLGNATIAAFKHEPLGRPVIVLNGQKEFFANTDTKTEVTLLLNYNGTDFDVYGVDLFDYHMAGVELRMFEEGNEIFVGKTDGNASRGRFTIVVMGRRHLRFIDVNDNVLSTMNEMHAEQFAPWSSNDITFDAKAGLLVDSPDGMRSRFYVIIDEHNSSDIVSFVMGAEVPVGNVLHPNEPIKYFRYGTHFDPGSHHSDDRIHALSYPEHGFWLAVSGIERYSDRPYIWFADYDCETTQMLDYADLGVNCGEYVGVPLLLVDNSGYRRCLTIQTENASGDYFLKDYNLDTNTLNTSPMFGSIERSYHQGNLGYINLGRSLRMTMRRLIDEHYELGKYDILDDFIYPNVFAIDHFYSTNEYRENKYRTGSFAVRTNWDWHTYCATGGDTPNVAEAPATPALDTEVFPNPYNAMTSVKVTVSDPTDIRVAVYNLMGQEVYRANKLQAAQGFHKFAVNSVDWSNGIYFLKVEANRQTQMKKLVLVK